MSEPRPGVPDPVPPYASGPELDTKVSVLAPTSAAGGLAAFLEATRPSGDRTAASGDSAPPFAPVRLEVIGALSAALLADSALARDPATVAVAYWMRPAQTRRLAADFERRVVAEPEVVRVPVGRVLHIAPANVDTLFIYSWALSFLCGNANLVRVSQDHGPIVAAILRAIDRVARDHEELRARDAFITYAHDDRVTSALSAWCSHRVIWGGSEAVAGLRPLALAPNASERTFGTKFSYSVFEASRYLAGGETERARVASAFFNDFFWFDQMACSSPHVVFWVGAERDFDPAVTAFEKALQGEVDRKAFVPAVSSAVQRRAFAFELAASATLRVELGRPGFVGVRVPSPAGLDRETCGGGFLRHCRLDRLEDLVRFGGEGDQTVTHFGFGPHELRSLARALGARGVDRVVPVGEALAFDVVWDGYDLLDDFTRRVRLRTE